MKVKLSTIQKLKKLIGERETSYILKFSKKQDIAEAKWRKRFEEEIADITKKQIAHAKESGRLNLSKVDFTKVVMEHSYEIMTLGINSTKRPEPVRAQKRLGTAPPSGIPRNLKALRIMWDQWNKRGKVPARQKDIAKRLKKAYIEKLQSVWVRYGEEFRSGDTASTEKAIRAVMKGADVVYSRAKMIVETETTFYYNKMRRDIYDQSDDVTHYLFVAIRDHATTKWCKSRHFTVYKKTDPLLKKETPPIHWNCRSEILPLLALNPAHLKLIEDKSLQRRNKQCEPLPLGWTAA